MRKLFQYMGMYWKTVLLVFLILIVQAYCDLSLPAYTSDIVNVGIQQGGISEPVPKAVSREGMERILILLPDPEDQEKVLDAYEEDFSSYDKEAFVLKESMQEEAEEGGEAYDELAGILSLPMMLIQGFSSGSDTTEQIQAQLMAGIPAEMVPEDGDVFDILGMLPPEQVEQMLEEIQSQTADMPETILEQAAISYVKPPPGGICGERYSARWWAFPTMSLTSFPRPLSSPGAPTTSSRSRCSWSCCCAWYCMRRSWRQGGSTRYSGPMCPCPGSLGWQSS